MKVIVTTGLKGKSYPGYLPATSIEQALAVIGGIDLLVLHRLNPEEPNFSDRLSALLGRSARTFYISSPGQRDSLVSLHVIGNGGTVIDDEFYLDSAGSLDNLTSETNTSLVTSSDMGGVKVLKDFISKAQSGSPINPAFLKVVSRATEGVVEQFTETKAELERVSRAATVQFERISKKTERLQAVGDEAQTQLTKLMTAVQAAQNNKTVQSSTPSSQSSIIFFPRVTYPKKRNIILIKEYGDVRLLTSFSLGLRLYIEGVKYRKPKLVFIMPAGDQYTRKFDGFSWVTRETQKSSSRFNQVIFVNHPSKDILFEILDDEQRYDTYIIVDRTKMSPQHILNYGGSKTFNAVSGSSAVSKFKLDPTRCISSVSALEGVEMNIPNVKLSNSDYFPSKPEDKESVYEGPAFVKLYEQILKGVSWVS